MIGYAFPPVDPDSVHVYTRALPSEMIAWLYEEERTEYLNILEEC